MELRVEITGIIGCILITISQIPQLVMILINKNSRNISLPTYYVLLIAQVVWILYGVFKNDIPILLTNILGSIITFAIIVATLFFSEHVFASPRMFLNLTTSRVMKRETI